MVRPDQQWGAAGPRPTSSRAERSSDGFTRGGWFVPHLDEDVERGAGTGPGAVDAFPFGRRADENFASTSPPTA
ncbi:hypothetical protein AB0I16_11510 [Streptomyces sp. NPDC050703]|uniref:hypothetical protein n=1 Tax=Streptomyces sp. NPDC050703 TaxID=3157218 RepID=UPI003428904E